MNVLLGIITVFSIVFFTMVSLILLFELFCWMVGTIQGDYW